MNKTNPETPKFSLTPKEHLGDEINKVRVAVNIMGSHLDNMEKSSKTLLKTVQKFDEEYRKTCSHP